ncbi:alanine racemase [Phytohabitans sp. ZYX-F-186]|uniref:Alanine racemase n=1 Tax=Phytohabitans maris TaxID=3071409 RepID=A0ABU0ZIB4_9ACTN|nr:alanine racemase [Phytohabitans sp. ZYX-F-186]MDQ7906159.1 alanine racemase [Phytohabitans sp. ZYX-F-186]
MLPEPVHAALAGRPSPVCAYVYDTGTLRATAAALRAALPPGATLLYAIKANGHPAVVSALAGACDGLEVASGGELAQAVAAGARTIAFGGPAKTDDELRAAILAGALVHVEGVLELRRLAALATAPLDIALRVNRAGGTPGGTHRMTGAPTPFGIDEAQLPAAAALAATLPRLRVVGFHLHAVSNNLDADAHTAFVDDAVHWSVAAAARLGIPLSYVNVGGGLGIDYTSQAALELPRLRAQPPPPGVRLVFEPGRFLAAGAGWYAAEVLDLKHTHGRWFAVLRGGTHHFRLPAAWGYSHPFTVLPRDPWPYDFPRPEVGDVEVDAVGELCTPRDVLTRAQRVDRLRVGDVLVFGNAGAYGWDISHHDYLRHPHPDFLVL